MRLFSKRPPPRAWPQDPTKIPDGTYGPFLWPVMVKITNGKVAEFTDVCTEYAVEVENNTLYLVDRHTGKRVDYK
jgi:hypothetical protein